MAIPLAFPADESRRGGPMAGGYRFGALDLDPERGRVLDLYQRAKTRQWDAAGLDWAAAPREDNPLGIADEDFVLAGHPAWERAGPAARAELRRHYTAWLLSQFLHGEQAALLCGGRVVTAVPDLDLKLYAATQVMDEARHAEVYTRFLDEQVGLAYPMDGPLLGAVEHVMADARWDLTLLGLQVVVEGIALAAFGAARELVRRPLPRAILDGVVADEARHVAFGRLALREQYRQLTTAELREREDFVLDSVAALAQRFEARTVWEHLGMDERSCVAAYRRSRYFHAIARQMTRHLHPTLRDIGLLSPRVREGLAGLVSGYEPRPEEPRPDAVIAAQERARRAEVDELSRSAGA